jgi:uncharacterized membrane-anchored protein
MISDTQWLKIAYCYINHQINPQPTIELDTLSSLNVEDLHAVTPDMFEIRSYDDEEVKEILKALNLIILKKENEDKNIK